MLSVFDKLKIPRGLKKHGQIFDFRKSIYPLFCPRLVFLQWTNPGDKTTFLTQPPISVGQIKRIWAREHIDHITKT